MKQILLMGMQKADGCCLGAKVVARLRLETLVTIARNLFHRPMGLGDALLAALDSVVRACCTRFGLLMAASVGTALVSRTGMQWSTDR